MLKKVTRFCKECYNFEDRRDIDGTVLCAKNHVPGVCCEDFIVKDESLKETRLNTRFCSECAHFEDRGDIDGTVICARNHSPGISCEDFVDRLEKLTKIRTQNHIKTTIIEHYINKNPTMKSRENTQTILVEILRNNEQLRLEISKDSG